MERRCPDVWRVGVQRHARTLPVPRRASRATGTPSASTRATTTPGGRRAGGLRRAAPAFSADWERSSWGLACCLGSLSLAPPLGSLHRGSGAHCCPMATPPHRRHPHHTPAARSPLPGLAWATFTTGKRSMAWLSTTSAAPSPSTTAPQCCAATWAWRCTSSSATPRRSTCWARWARRASPPATGTVVPHTDPAPRPPAAIPASLPHGLSAVGPGCQR